MPENVTEAEWHAELATRRAAVWQIVRQHNCDIALIFGSTGHSEPFRYLTNFVPVLGDCWGLLTGSQQMACVLNFNWQLEEARRLSGVEAWYGLFDPHPRLTELLKAAAPQRIGVVGLHRLPVTAFEAIKTALPGVTFEDITSAVAFLRRQKSPLEARLLREAGRITDAAFDAIRTEIKPGMTEVEVAARLGYHMQGMGAELSFAPTVVSGNLDPIPIRMPTQRQLEIGDSVMIDMGAEYQGYQADASRTFVLGEPNDKQREVWETIVRAYDASLAKIRPGVPCNELHKAAVQVFTDAGYDLVHRVGHGIGLATSFEWPSLDTETSPLIEGMTFCLEPGIYVEGAGNMKYEDDVLVTKDGYELLTSSSNAIVVPV